MQKPLNLSRSGLDRHSRQSLHEQLYERIRRAVLDGRLSTGTRLPSTRALASELALARGTVDNVYARLVSEGYLTARRQHGTIVTPGLRRPTPSRAKTPVRDTGATQSGISQPWFPLQLGLPAMDLLPRTTWTRIAKRQIQKLPPSAFAQPDPMGLPALRQMIASYLAISRGIPCPERQVIVTHGYQDALNLAIELLAKRGDRVWVEEPGYGFTQRTLALRGLTPVPVPVDDEGVIVQVGRKKAPRARLAVVTPAHQFPTSTTLSTSRRWELLNWASGAQAWILEDDYDCEFHYIGLKPASLKSVDVDDRVLYVGSFSKTLFPALRMGYLVVPASLTEAATRLQVLRYRGVSTLEQLVLTEFIRQGHFARHLRRMRNEYRIRRSSLADAITSTLGEMIEVTDSAGGLHLLAKFRKRIDDRWVARLALKAKLKPAPLSGQYLSSPSENGLLLGFTNVQAERAAGIALALSRLVKS